MYKSDRPSNRILLPAVFARLTGMLGIALIAIVLLLYSPEARGQNASNGYEFTEPNLALAFGTEANFNAQDLFIKFHLGVGDTRNLWSLRFFLDFRPFEKVIWKKTEGITHQYRAKRYILGLTADKMILPIQAGIFSCGFYVEGKAGYSFGNYRGTENQPTNGFVAVPSGGIAFNWSNTTILKIGAERYPQPNQTIDLWRAEIGLMFMPSQN